MKILLALCFLLSSFATFADSNPDILAYSRTDKQWNLFLLEEFRVFMTNLNMEGVDPKTLTLSDPIIYSEENIRSYVTDELHSTLLNVGEIVGLRYDQMKPSLVVNDFGYAVKKITPVIKPLEDADGNVTLSSTVTLEGLEASAADLSLQFEIEGLKKKPTIKIINPTIVLKRGATIDFDVDVKFVESTKSMKLELSGGNFSRITQKLADDPELIDIIFDEHQIEFPRITGSFAGRDLEVSRDKIIGTLIKEKSNLKILLFEQLHEMLKKNVADELLKKFDNIAFKSDTWIEPTSDGIFPVYLHLKDMSVPFGDIYMAEIAGDFCTTRNYVATKDNCIHSRKRAEPTPTRTKSDLKKSKEIIRKNFETRPDLKILLSVSENYINKAIVTTIDFGLWDSIMAEMQGASLGDKGAVIKLDEKGNNATLLMDIIYPLSKLEGFAVGRKFVRFPAVLKANARIENQMVDGKEQAQVIFNVYDVSLNDDLIKNGHKEYGFPSNVKDMRRIFRKKVLKMIKAELFAYDAPKSKDRLKVWKGMDLPGIPLPEVNNMHLDKMHIESDALGRVNIILEGDTPVFRNGRRRRRRN